jgi:hypothetical protein
VSSAAVPNSIAAICLAMRDEFGLIPHVYVDWTEGSPLIHFLRLSCGARARSRRAEPGRMRPPELQLCRYWLTLPGEGS